jgi:outer membrane immunogenic protein
MEGDMRRISVVTFLSLLSSLPAIAADLPSVKAPPAYAAPPALFSWTGLYIGGNFGYAFSGNDNIQTLANDSVTAAQFAGGTVPSSYQLSPSGLLAGGQIGYNYEFSGTGAGSGGFVTGVEADLDYSDLRRGNEYLGNHSVVNDYQRQMDYLGTIRGRIGYAFDRVLVYGTGGFAYGHVSATQSIFAGNDANALIWGGTGSGLRTGYVAGGGIEYALPASSALNPFNAEAATLRVEYLHYDLGTSSFDLVGGLGAPYYFTDRVKTDGNIVRGALNYILDFGSPATPVVAKY